MEIETGLHGVTEVVKNESRKESTTRQYKKLEKREAMKYTWLYQVEICSDKQITQFDNYSDFYEYINQFKEWGYAVQIVHATKNDPMTYAYIW